mmetsp:Transcript_106407/g.237535  ORF Transcript_106407/g.237535 Transcript_106407/m.237535 type:complete len:96 (+) Transcript_106407:213-500(+)
MGTPCGPYMSSAMESLLEGRGPLFGYFLWFVFLSLGIARWRTGFECALYAVVDEVQVTPEGEVVSEATTGLRKPLLTGQDNGQDGSTSLLDREAA